ELHHIFPKNLLYKAGYARPEVNALANFTFLTKGTNLEVTNRDPAEYIPAFDKRHPGVLASHWIPMESDLWRIENYLDFLEARRELLADAANEFLEALAGGSAPDTEAGPRVVDDRTPVRSVVPTEDDEASTLDAIQGWMREHGLAEGERDHEL